MPEQPTISQKRFDERVRYTSLVTTVVFHLSMFMLMWLVTCSAPLEPEETLTEITWGGGGGAPGFTGEEGPAMRGVPSQDPQPSAQSAESTPSQQRAEQTPRTINSPRTSTHSTERVRTQRDEPTRSPSSSPSNPQPSSTPSGTPSEAPRPSEAPSGGQNPEGTGDRPASGSGGGGQGTGAGVGIGGGVGSRGWIRKPSASASGLEASGTVSLRFTVLPDGSISNIVPLSRPHPGLVSRAIAGMSGARARPLPEDAPQVSETYTINFNFYFKD